MVKRVTESEVPGTLTETLELAVGAFPSHGVGFIRPGNETFITFPELETKALSMLVGLQSRGLRQGDMVILSLERSEEIIPVLWGCFLGGIVPALLQPPVSFTEYNPAAEKTEQVFTLLREPHVIRSHQHEHNWKTSRIPATRQIDVRKLAGDASVACRAEVGPGDLAMIQFSSGSTGDPKGVQLTHRNLLVNIRAIIRAIALTSADVSVNWMPLYHDMGLIGFHFTPVLAGVNQYFIDPVDFVKHPSLWLDAMSRTRCTISACPNFGQLLVNRYLGRKRQPEWDLSPLRILFNGAEPISVPVMRAFLDGLKPAGLNPRAMFPAYGLAEATLAVTLPERHSGAEVRTFNRMELIAKGRATEVSTDDPAAIELVNLGTPVDDCTVTVTAHDYEPVGDGIVGNVLVKGPQVTPGYFASHISHSALFHNGWLLTGDLGFTFRGGLYITGRSKDIIFINGVNYYAHDLEAVAQRLEGIAAGKVVIAGDFDEQEGRDKLLVFIVGADNDLTRELCLKLKSHLTSVVGVTTEIFIPIRSSDVPRTSSGKLQRYKLVEKYRRGVFPSVITL